MMTNDRLPATGAEDTPLPANQAASIEAWLARELARSRRLARRCDPELSRVRPRIGADDGAHGEARRIRRPARLPVPSPSYLR
jgi:hypothetical protein